MFVPYQSQRQSERHPPNAGTPLKNYDLIMLLLAQKNAILSRNNAIVTISVRDCGSNWPVDFGQNGEIRNTRVPLGDPVIVWYNGVAWYVVYGGYTILGGAHPYRVDL